MSKELLLVAEALSNEKGVSKEIVLEAIQSALETATKKLSGRDIGVRVELNTKTGEYKTFRYWDVVSSTEDIIDPENQIILQDALEKDSTAKVGERVEEEMPSVEFGRIAAQSARVVMVQKVRDAERKHIVDQFRSKIGHLVYGTVRKVTRDYIILDLGGKADALLPRTAMLPQEMFRVNDRVRAYLYEISENGNKGAQIFVSRTCKEMLIELFRIEVPEIGENVIDIKAAARDPGNRAKIAVKTKDGRIDPIGACVGMRGARVQAVSTELKGERVDIVLWDDNPAQFVLNAMAPAEVSSIVVDEDAHTMDIAVESSQLSQAIGRNGQNIKLASQLTGWTLNVMTVEEFEGKNQVENTKLIKLFMDNLGIDDEFAAHLVAQGFSSVEEIAYVPQEELLAIDGVDEDIVEDLRNRANDALLALALSSASNQDNALLTLDGMSAEILQGLAELNINTMEELAECSVDEIIDIIGMTEEKAAEFIMKAREPWFLDKDTKN